MEFDNTQPIYLQIAEHIRTQILKNTLLANQRLLSVREQAVQLEVNPNTIVKSYGYLEEQNLIYKQRGKGYFVSEHAQALVLSQKRIEFEQQTLPQLFQQMALLDYSFENLKEAYNKQN